MHGEAADFAKIRVFGVQYACSDGRAVATRWNPSSGDDDMAGLEESVVVNDRVFTVEVLVRGLFAKSCIGSIVIPKGVRALPDKCFEFCERLSAVSFAEGSRVKSLGKCCFKMCHIDKIVIPDSCLCIGEKCFDGCVNLCTVDISERSELVKLGSFAFRGCCVSNLFLPKDVDLSESSGVFVGVKSFTAAKNSKIVVSGDCVLQFVHGNERDDTYLIHVSSDQCEFEVPDAVSCIVSWCFCGSKVSRVVFG